MRADPRYGKCSYCMYGHRLMVGDNALDSVFMCTKFNKARGYDPRWGNRPIPVYAATEDCFKRPGRTQSR